MTSVFVQNSGPYNAQWHPVDHYYTCTVDKPKKESKLKGLKSFIAYTLTSSTSRIQAPLFSVSDTFIQQVL